MIFLRTLSSLDVDLIDRTHEGSGAFETRSTTEKLPMSALGQKQTSEQVRIMSLYPQKRTSAERIGMSAKCCQKPTSLGLLDNLVRTGNQRGRHGEAKRLGGLEVDDQFVLGRGLYRKVGRLLAF